MLRLLFIAVMAISLWACGGDDDSSCGPSTSASDLAVRWFGSSAAVRANQDRDRSVSTLPLPGMGSGRTTSNAEMRSDATNSSRSSSIA